MVHGALVAGKSGQNEGGRLSEFVFAQSMPVVPQLRCTKLEAYYPVCRLELCCLNVFNFARDKPRWNTQEAGRRAERTDVVAEVDLPVQRSQAGGDVLVRL